MKLPSTLAASLAATLLASVSSAQNLLANPDFEQGNLNGWMSFGNAHPASAGPGVVPLSGTEIATIFGNFSGGFDVAGIFQEFSCNPGDQFFLDCFSRHNSGDALTGPGLPDFNWAVMKIAFFDAFNVEIAPAASEAVILDGNSPTDQWINNTPITATAPIGAAFVQPLILFLQPFNDGGAAHIDDVFFGPGLPVSAYPGPGDDAELATGINGASPSGPGDDIKGVNPGDTVEIRVSSPGGTHNFDSYYLVGQTFLTGSPPAGLGGMYIDLFSTLFVLVGPVTSPIGSPLIAPGGSSSHFQVPAGLSGFSLMLQGFPLSSAALNGVFGISNGQELQFL